jgi:hypothetical protein
MHRSHDCLIYRARSMDCLLVGERSTGRQPASLPVRGVTQPAPDQAGLSSASVSDVPFGAALRRPAAVVLARCSAPERVSLIADTAAVGGTHSTGCRGPSGLSTTSCPSATVPLKRS